MTGTGSLREFFQYFQFFLQRAVIVASPSVLEGQIYSRLKEMLMRWYQESTQARSCCSEPLFVRGFLPSYCARGFSPRHMAPPSICVHWRHIFKRFWVAYSLTIQEHTVWSQALRRGNHCGGTWPEFSPSSTWAPRDRHVSRPGIEPGSPALKASTQAKSCCSEPLFVRGFLPSLCARGFSPRHLAPPSIYVFIEDIYLQGLDSLFTDNPGAHSVISSPMLGSPLWRNLTRVLSILYLITSRQTCVSAGNQTRVACVAGKNSSKELFEQLIYLLLGTTICAGIFTLLLSRGFSPRHKVIILAKPAYHTQIRQKKILELQYIYFKKLNLTLDF